MPQLYWGQNYTKNGSTAQSLCQLAARWASLPRAEDVTLAVGLGAYRIGALNTLGIDYIGLYRYDSLFNNTAYPTLAAAEQDSVAQIWRGD